MTPAIGQFHLDRHIAAPPDRLWHLLTDPDMRTQWGAPSDDDVLIMETHDLREGGHELHRCGPADNPAYTVATVWYRLAAPHLACFSETVDAEGLRIATSLVTYGLRAHGDGTDFSVDVQISSFVGPAAFADFESGWISALSRLEILLEKSPA